MNLPPQFITQTQSLLGDVEWQKLSEALEEPQPISIRLNQNKIDKYGICLSQDIFESIPWCESGFYLSARPTFTYDPLFHSGAYYVQEASSMFIEQNDHIILFITDKESIPEVEDLFELRK